MLSNRLTIEDIKDEINGKRVLMRVDYNVPMADGKVKDSTKIEKTLKSINYCLDHGARGVVLMSHLGRPDGKYNEKYSLRPISDKLSELLGGRVVTFLKDCVGEDTVNYCKELNNGEVVLLENLRFHIEEEITVTNENGQKVKADAKAVEDFQNALTQLGDIYINDAFGTAHRPHSSIVGVHHDIKAAGFLMKDELKAFGQVLDNPEKPLLLIMGGSKVHDKIKLIKHMLDK